MSLTPLVEPHVVPAGEFYHEAIRDVYRAGYRLGATLPALGLVLLNAGRYTDASHFYRATMRPVATADAPSPAAVFSDRDCYFFWRDGDAQPVVVVPWQAGDMAATGRFRCQVKAVAQDTAAVEYLPPVLIEVAA